MGGWGEKKVRGGEKEGRKVNRSKQRKSLGMHRTKAEEEEKRVIKRERRDVDGNWNKGRGGWRVLRSGVVGLDGGKCVKCVCVGRKDDGEQKIIMHN